MAHYFAEIQGSRGRTSRTGTKNSGLIAEIKGWDVGISISMYHKNGKDYIDIYETGGSNNLTSLKKISTVREKSIDYVVKIS